MKCATGKGNLVNKAKNIKNWLTYWNEEIILINQKVHIKENQFVADHYFFKTEKNSIFEPLKEAVG